MLLAACVLAGVLAMSQAKPSDLAYNNGYQAGFKLGQTDKKSGERPDYTQASAYRRATDGWKEGTGGDLEAYRTNYRNGFADGYKDGLGEEPKVPSRQVAPPPEPERLPERQPEPVVVAPPPPPPPPVQAAPMPPPAVAMAGGAIPEGTVLQLTLNSTLSTRRNRQGDNFTATVAEPVLMEGSTQVLIPAGATIAGVITRIQRPGRVKGTGEMHMRYDRLTIPGGGEYSMSATTSGLGDTRTGKVDESEGTVKGNTSHGRDAAAIGGTTATGAVIGGVTGGPAGAGVGALIGLGVGVGGVLVTRGKDIDLPKDTTMQIKLLTPLNIGRGAR
jgi:type IV secretion system protein VirB10